MNRNNELLHDLKINRQANIDKQPLGFFRFMLYLSFLIMLPLFVWIVWTILKTWDIRAPVEVSTVVVRAETTQQNATNTTTLDASGYITAKRQATVSSKITGKISEILFEEGMKVEKGQVLARLDDRILQAELDLNEAEHIAAKASLIELEVELKYALRQFHRSNNLFDKKSIGIAELDKATVDVHILRSRKERLKREIDVSEKSIKVKKQTLEDTIIRAPFSGVVISKDAQPGEMVSPMSAGGGFVRTGLSTIVDMESLEIEVDINENYINRIMVNQSATATLNAYPDWSIPVSVIAIVPTADRKKATVKVKLALKEQDSRIIPDLGVKVSFHKNLEIESIAATREVAMLIPTQVLQPDNQSDQVYVIVNNRVQVRDTELLGERGKWRRVSSGVREGDQVIISSSRQLRSGELVTVKN